MTNGGYRYELTCEIDPERERQYRDAISDAVVEWFEFDGLVEFQPLSAIDGQGDRLQFEFTDRESLDRFADAPGNRETLNRLRSVCIRVETHRWRPGSVSLNGGSSATTPCPDTFAIDRVSE